MMSLELIQGISNSFTRIGPSLYYTPEIWYSQEASEVMIVSDRRKMLGKLSPENNDLDDLVF
jgi:hypothetical protein